MCTLYYIVVHFKLLKITKLKKMAFLNKEINLYKDLRMRNF
jgi:hypothetical protein